jgi:23S rRNA pseudouridine1911/1915/1917 synthase
MQATGPLPGLPGDRPLKTQVEEPWRELDYEVLPDDARMRLDLFLNDRMIWRSRSSIQKLIEEGGVRVKEGADKGGSVLKPSRRVRPGEIYGVTIPKPKREIETLAARADLEIPVLYDDEWIVVVNKPAGIPVHPGGRLLDRTVITLLNEQRLQAGGDAASPLKLCHRLDLETSGALLISRDTPYMPKFVSQFERREAAKEYLALVHGEMDRDTGEIDLPIGMAEGSAINMKRGVNFKKGQSARTTYTVERRFAGFTLVRLRLHTGRHHQLRVHLSAIGHPIVGDKAYGLDENLFILYHQNRLDEAAKAMLILPRQALHAARLSIRHVVLGRRITFEAPMPREITDFMDSLSGREEKQ